MAEPAEQQPNPEGQESAPKGDAEPKKKDPLTFVTLGLVILNLGILGGMGFFLKKMLGQIKELKDRPPVVIPAEPEKEDVMGAEFQPKKLGILFPLEGFLVNLSGGGGPKFLQVQMELELDNASVEGELTRKRAAVRDAIIVLLSSKSYRELRDPKGIRNLRKDIIASVQNLLKEGEIKDVYFTQFHFN